MLLEHEQKTPTIHPEAWVAPNATLSGDVHVGKDTRVLFGAVVTADGGPVRIGERCVVMENAVLRGVGRHPLTIGNRVLVGPGAYLSGCSIEDETFLATRSTVFNGARVGRGAEVRGNGVVHLRTVLPPGAVVPINWIAVGDPAEILPPGHHDQIWAIQEPLDFPREIFGVARSEDMMREIMDRYSRRLGGHISDRVIET